MPLPRFVVLSGAIDGINTAFSTGMPYVPGSFAGFTNGLLTKFDDLDGWTELDPAAGTVQWTTAPLAGDVVQGFFLDTVPAPLEIVCLLSASVRSVDGPMARFKDVSVPTGALEAVPGLNAIMKVCG